MLIAIAGSQGTGKSTLLNELSKHYPVVTRKTSRSILDEWNVTLSEVNNNRDLTIKFQDEILARKIADEKEAVESDEIYFTERTYMDLFTYALIALGKDNEYSDWLNHYYTKCLEAQSTYKAVFYLSAGHFAPVEDGVRAVNQHYSHMVDVVMFSYTIKAQTPGQPNNFHHLITPDNIERVNNVIKYTDTVTRGIVVSTSIGGKFTSS